MSEYSIGSIVKVFGSVYVKTSSNSWDVYNMEYRLQDKDVTDFFKEYRDDSIEVLREPGPDELLSGLPTGSIARTPNGTIWRGDGDRWVMLEETEYHISQTIMDEIGGAVIYKGSKLEGLGPGTVLRGIEDRDRIASVDGDGLWRVSGDRGVVYSNETVEKVFGGRGYEVVVEVKR